MDFMNDIFLEYEVSMLKLNHICESEYDKFSVYVNELNLNQSIYNMITESDVDIVYESKRKGFIATVVQVISDLIDMVLNMIIDIKNRIVAFITGQNAKKTLSTADDIIKGLSDEELKQLGISNKVRLTKDEKETILFNKYIQEMCKLERELMTLKVDYKLSGNLRDGTFITEYQNISKKVDELNKQFDADFINNRSEEAEMALRDSIRFSMKQLDTVEFDFNEFEKGSKKVLKQFKKDAEGCKVPEQANLLQTMSNSIATRVRKTLNRMSSYKHKNLTRILVVAGAICGIKMAMKNPTVRNKVVGKLTEINNTLQAEPTP